jgi:hypothetical protein
MPIASYKPTSPIQTNPNKVTLEQDVVKSIYVSDEDKAIKSLVTYVSGAPWSVQWYAGVVTEHSDIRELDTSQKAIFQQYEKINNLEIRVTTPLTESNDSTIGTMKVEGSGLLYGNLVPNVNNYFLTNSGDNNTGFFRVTRVERRSFNNDSVYTIEYVLVGFTSNSTVRTQINNIESKVIRQYYFNKDRVADGLQPLLKSEDHQQILDLNVLYKNICLEYFRTFFNKRYSTLVLPGQDTAIYDGYIVSYLMKIVTSRDAPELMLLRQHSNEENYCLEQPTIFNALLKRDISYLELCNKNMTLVSKNRFNKNSYTMGLMYTNINYVVYPETYDSSSQVGDDPSIITIPDIATILDTKNFQGSLYDAIDNTYTTSTQTYKLYYPVLRDANYVLSDSFYSNLPDMSVLEILTKDYLNRNTLDIPMLLTISNRFKYMPRLEQFYYGPIIITLIKTAIFSTYS